MSRAAPVVTNFISEAGLTGFSACRAKSGGPPVAGATTTCNAEAGKLLRQADKEAAAQHALEEARKEIESGKLDAELVRIADVTEGDLDRQLKTAVAMAEPLMLFVIAAFIGTIFIGMVIPIFTLQEHIK